MTQDPVVYIVDDDEASCSSLMELVESVGLKAETFYEAEAFLASFQDSPGCLLLDVRMPGMSGMELYEKLIEHQISIPTIFITAHGDIPMAVRSIKRGAIDFFEKPFRPQVLLDRVQEAIALDRDKRHAKHVKMKAQESAKKLTPRESQIMRYLAKGKTSNAIAKQLHLSAKTVRIHRSRIMSKMGVESPVQLSEIVRILEQP